VKRAVADLFGVLHVQSRGLAQPCVTRAKMQRGNGVDERRHRASWTRGGLFKRGILFEMGFYLSRSRIYSRDKHDSTEEIYPMARKRDECMPPTTYGVMHRAGCRILGGFSGCAHIKNILRHAHRPVCPATGNHRSTALRLNPGSLPLDSCSRGFQVALSLVPRLGHGFAETVLGFPQK
jgi:hypothetical protein